MVCTADKGVAVGAGRSEAGTSNVAGTAIAREASFS